MGLDRDADCAGLHACDAALQAGQLQCLLLPKGALNRRQQSLLEAASAAGVEVQRGDAATFAASAPFGLRHQGALGWLARAAAVDPANADPWTLLAGLSHPPLILVLDGIEDPRNLGACLRSADGAGADMVILPRSRGAPVTAVTRKTAAGAAESIPVLTVANLAQCLARLRQQGITVIGLADETEVSVYDLDLRGGCALVLGNEGQGLRHLTREHCDQVVALPMAGQVSSLNVSVATGIVLYEAVRQRRLTVPLVAQR